MGGLLLQLDRVSRHIPQRRIILKIIVPSILCALLGTSILFLGNLPAFLLNSLIEFQFALTHYLRESTIILRRVLHHRCLWLRRYLYGLCSLDCLHLQTIFFRFLFISANYRYFWLLLHFSMIITHAYSFFFYFSSFSCFRFFNSCFFLWFLDFRGGSMKSCSAGWWFDWLSVQFDVVSLVSVFIAAAFFFAFLYCSFLNRLCYS